MKNYLKTMTATTILGAAMLAPANADPTIDGAWTGRAVLESASQGYADCPPIVDFGVTIANGKVVGAVKDRASGGAIRATLTDYDGTHHIEGGMVVNAWVEYEADFTAKYADGEFRGELDAGSFCFWRLEMTKVAA